MNFSNFSGNFSKRFSDRLSAYFKAMKSVTAIWLVALGLVVGVVLGQLLQYNRHRIENFINKLKRK